MTTETGPTTSRAVARLPKWAQEHIDLLERRLEACDAELEALRATAFKGSGKVSMNSDNAWTFDPTVLPDDAVVRFNFDRGQHIFVHWRQGAVYVNGSRSINIRPKAGNAVDLSIATDF